MNQKITNIVTENLFGYYNYNFKELLQNDIGRLLILYGDNGTGKSTILRCVFYLMSAIPSRGHKTALARTKFSKISIYFDDHHSVHAIRDKDLIGSYRIVVKNHEQVLLNNVLTTDNDDYRISPTPNDPYFSYLKERNCTLFFLPDNRKLLVSNDSEENEILTEELYLFNASRNKRTRMETAAAVEMDLIDFTINNLTKYIQDINLQSSQKGEQDTNAIYRDIIKGISSANIRQIDEEFVENKEKINAVLIHLETVGSRSNNLSKFGLISSINYNELKELIVNCSKEKQSIISSILEPYLNSVNARINALNSLYDTINTFTSNLNKYYFKDKEIEFNINTGFKIRHKSGEYIPFQFLSSGEKHLLMLMSNVVLASEQGSVFLIDEPELSLNIKWQRELLDTLLILNKSQTTQFILASHSMEILSTHRESVLKLETQDGITRGKN